MRVAHATVPPSEVDAAAGPPVFSHGLVDEAKRDRLAWKEALSAELRFSPSSPESRMSNIRPRILKPLPPIAVRPTTVTQLTCLEMLGVNARRFLELLAAHPDLPRTRLGKLAVVRIEDWDRWVVLHASVADDAVRDGDRDARDQPESAEAVLAQLGLRKRRAGGVD